MSDKCDAYRIVLKDLEELVQEVKEHVDIESAKDIAELLVGVAYRANYLDCIDWDELRRIEGVLENLEELERARRMKKIRLGGR